MSDNNIGSYASIVTALVETSVGMDLKLGGR